MPPLLDHCVYFFVDRLERCSRVSWGVVVTASRTLPVWLAAISIYPLTGKVPSKS
jgi:hypothetical protein